MQHSLKRTIGQHVRTADCVIADSAVLNSIHVSAWHTHSFTTCSHMPTAFPAAHHDITAAASANAAHVTLAAIKLTCGARVTYMAASTEKQQHLRVAQHVPPRYALRFLRRLSPAAHNSFTAGIQRGVLQRCSKCTVNQGANHPCQRAAARRAQRRTLAHLQPHVARAIHDADNRPTRCRCCGAEPGDCAVGARGHAAAGGEEARGGGGQDAEFRG